mgnify:CR=1 FL=1
MRKKRKSDFYLLRQKSLSEGDLFITDYIKTKQRLERLESEFYILQKIVSNHEIGLNNDKKN